mgnify:CR=1 FL=1
MSYRLLLTFILSCLAGSLPAQRVVSDAKIVYKMELPAEQLQADAMLQGSTFTQYMRGPLSRIDMNFNIVRYTYLINSKNKTLFSVYFLGNNLNDVAYQNHLSRLKYTDVNPLTGRQGVFNMGRSFSFKLNIPLSFDMK